MQIKFQGMAKKENTNVEQSDAFEEKTNNSQAFISKNSKVLSGALAVIVIVVVAVFFYKYFQKNKDQEARKDLFSAVFYFEKDSLDKALDGDGFSTEGLRYVYNEYKSTPSGNLAAYYIGAIHMQKGEYEDAIKYLKDFSSDDLLIQARAYALIGDAHFELEQYDNAITYLEKAANHRPNPQFTPTYLMKLALAYEEKEQYANAKNCYQRIVDEFENSSEVNNAKKYLGMMEQLSAKS